MILLGMEPEDVCEPFKMLNPPLVPFRDASYNPSTYDLHVKDVVAGMHQAILNKFVDLSDFDPDTYEYYGRVEHGDFNWIVDSKFISMAGPHNIRYVSQGYPHFCPEDFFHYFKEHNVTDVVRLNKPMYDASKFTKNGFKHHELFFIDGSTPPENILTEFLEVCENAKGIVAVHCKAGLGRTGTLIGCYLMKHYRLTASEAIAWLRLARPGSVIGPQQLFMRNHQARMWQEGEKLGVTRKTNANRPDWAEKMIIAMPLSASPSQSTRSINAINTEATSPSCSSFKMVSSVGSVRSMSNSNSTSNSSSRTTSSESSYFEDSDYNGTSSGSDESSCRSQGDQLTERKVHAQQEHAKNNNIAPAIIGMQTPKKQVSCESRLLITSQSS